MDKYRSQFEQIYREVIIECIEKNVDSLTPDKMGKIKELLYGFFLAGAKIVAIEYNAAILDAIELIKQNRRKDKFGGKNDDDENMNNNIKIV